jgi:hypothetical protein
LHGLTDRTSYDLELHRRTTQYSLHLYLGSGGGLLRSNDSNDGFAGEAFQQQSSTFSAASLVGNYGLNASGYNRTSAGSSQWGETAAALTAAVATGADELTGFAASNGAPADFALSGEFTLGARSFHGNFGGI